MDKSNAWDEILSRDDLGPRARGSIEACKEDSGPLHSVDSMVMNCDWRIAIENTLEHAHIPHVHKDTLGKLKLKFVDAYIDGKNSMGYYHITDERTIKSLKKLRQMFVSPTNSDKYIHLFIYPYTCISSVGGFTYAIQNYIPQGDKTFLLMRLFGAKVKPGYDLNFYFDSVAKFNRRVFEEDANMVSKIKHLRGGPNMKPELQRLSWFWEARNAE